MFERQVDFSGAAEGMHGGRRTDANCLGLVVLGLTANWPDALVIVSSVCNEQLPAFSSSSHIRIPTGSRTRNSPS